MQSFYDVILSPFNTPVAGAQVFVYKADGTLATLYDSNVPLSTTVLSSDGTSYYISEDLLSPISNPIVTGADGKYLFFAANGVYSIIIVAAGYDNKTLSIELNDPSVSPFVQTVNIQEFSTVGTSTWTKPAGAKFVEVLMYGGGGGGACGGRDSTGLASAYGGGGGSASARAELRLPASALNATETVVVAAGGTGAAGISFDDQFGYPGNTGGTSSFKTYSCVGGGNGNGDGVLSITANAIDAYRVSTTAYTAVGGASSTSIGSEGGRGGFRGGGGGAGGGWNASGGFIRPGRAGGLGGAALTSSFLLATGGGGNAGAAGGNGDPGPDAPSGYYVGGSGGGGGSQAFLAAGSGGQGGYPGGGGGGGAAARGAFDSGSGGDGGDGYVRVVTYL
jgi:hypothetical protein